MAIPKVPYEPETPTASERVVVQKTIMDLDTFEEVTLKKEASFVPAASTAEVMERIGNDSAKFLALVNEGLRTETQRNLRDNDSGWMATDEDGKITTAFSGTAADPQKVNQLVLTMAKTVYGYSKDLGADAKRQAKEQAMELIKNTPVMKEGLKNNAARS